MDPTGVVVIDSGRSGTRLRVLTGDTLRCRSDGPGIAMIVDEASLRGAIAVLDDLLDRVPASDISAVVLAAAAFARTGDYNRRLAAHLAERTGSLRVIVAADCVASHVGALAGEPGVVVAAGTGTVVCGLAEDGWLGTWDGHGYLFGDRGSGYAIGLAGLRAAATAYDLGQPSNDLLIAATARFGPVYDWPAALAMPDAVPAIAAFTPEVLALAEAGDAESRRIRTFAAAQLAGTVAAAVDDLVRRGSAAPVPVSWAGSLLRDGGLRADFVAALTNRAEPREPVGSALDGALLLAGNRSLRPHPGLVEVLDLTDAPSLA